MNRHVKTLVLLIGLLMIFGAVLAAVMLNRPADTDTDGDTIGSIGDAVHVTVVTPNGEMNFTDVGDNWVYDEDSDFPLNDRYVTAIVSAASKLTAIRTIPALDTWAAYGLAESFTTITVTDASGAELTVEIGGKIDDDKYYAHIPNADTVLVISSDLPEAASVELLDMVKYERLGEFDPEDVTAITVTAGGVTKELTLDDELRQTAAEIRFSGCVDYKADETALTAAGLDTAVTVTWTEGENTLYVGKSDGNGSYYAKIAGSRALYTVAPSMVEPFFNAVEG